MDIEDPKTVLEKVAEQEKAQTKLTKKWYCAKWFRIIRIPAGGLVMLGIIACCTVQPS